MKENKHLKFREGSAKDFTQAWAHCLNGGCFSCDLLGSLELEAHTLCWDRSSSTGSDLGCLFLLDACAWQLNAHTKRPPFDRVHKSRVALLRFYNRAIADSIYGVNNLQNSSS